MYIKQVIIQGFRSYRDTTIVDPFSPKHNVVVGRNGSGKSNFFYAIQFVLSDEFNNLKPEQRTQLLHESSGPRVMSAFVEIIFDNSDNRLPIDKDEVSVRRVIGAKKDTYFLDKKSVTKSDVMNLLESAGFSRSNPYYIVKQGKINQMATAPDSHRIKLLREVAGTKVYDERKTESEGILRETQGKREKIEDLLKYIEERLQTLEEEKEELAQYQKWDKMRRSLEYTIHNHELTDTRKKLDDLTSKRENSGENSKYLRDEYETWSLKVKTLSKDLRDVKGRIKTISEEKEQINGERQDLFKRRAKLELLVKDLTDELTGDQDTKERIEDQLVQLEEIINTTKNELDIVKPQYQELQKEEEEHSERLASHQQRRTELYAKQGRRNQFSSREQRDDWIKKELRSLRKSISDKMLQVEKIQRDIDKDSRSSQSVQQEVAKQEAEQEKMRKMIADNNESFFKMKEEKDRLQNQRNALWREENTLQQEINNMKEELSRKEQNLRSMCGKALLNGIDSVKRVLDSFRKRGINQEVVDGYHGLLIENFSCQPKFYTCVEVTSGNRLFHHIVENDLVSTKILEEMNRQKMPGECTFMPLNRLRLEETDYPDTVDALPMIKKLEFTDQYARPFRHVFGKTLICRSMDVATQLARSQNLDCVTLDGDQVSRRGALTGGYHDARKSRIELQRAITDLREQLEEKEGAYSGHQRNLQQVEVNANKLMSDMQKVETKNRKSKDISEELRAKIRLKREEQQVLERSLQPRQQRLQSLQANITSMENSAHSLESEMGTELMSQLQANEQREVDQLNDQIKQLTQTNKEILGRRIELEGKKNKLENLLTDNLVRKREQLEAELQEISIVDKKRRLQNTQKELTEVVNSVKESKKKLEDVEMQAEQLVKEQVQMGGELDDSKNNEREHLEMIQDDTKELEKITNQQSLLLKKKEDCMRKIRELGSLPSEAFSAHTGLSLKQLFKKLESCNGELKKYSHVNKKALDQFMNFSDQKEKLIKRKDELDKGQKAIEDLMTALDQRKYEAVLFTFRQVSKYFSEVFLKLVPGGTATLVMKRGDIDQSSQELDSGSSQPGGSQGGPSSVPLVEQFTGISIKVSFSGKAAETREMQQLSGGQKSLVALTLIFAIQKCDPAPFYLFDEIDSALDAQHRKAVADMIHELSEEAQFITTTFRPELLEPADKFYGVLFRNKVSHIETVSRLEAQDFLEDDTSHE